MVSIIFLTLTAEVFFRYFLNSPLEWSGELAIYAFIWSTFIGGSMSIKTKTSTVITIFTEKLNPKFQRIVYITTLFIVVAFCVFTLFYSLQWILSPHTLFERSLSTGMPMFIPYLGVPIGIGFMAIHSLYHLLNEVFNGNTTEVGDK